MKTLHLKTFKNEFQSLYLEGRQNSRHLLHTPTFANKIKNEKVKRNSMAKTDFARRDPILCNFSIVDQVFLPQDTLKSGSGF